MNGDDPYATDWISALTPEERRKLILLTSEMFSLALSSPTAAMSLIGAGNKVAVARTVQPIMAMNPSGKLVPLINSSNVLPVTEASGAGIASSVSGLDTTQDRVGWPTIQGGKPDSDVYLGTAQITLVGGSKADNVLVPKVANMYGVVMPFAAWADTADTYTFAFQDEDNTALTPALCTEFNVTWAVLKTCIGFGGATTGPYHFPWFKGTVVNKDLECDVTGGAGAEKIVIWFWYWYESA